MTFIPQKQWIAEEAQRTGKRPSGILARLYSGKYRRLIRRQVNQRVVMVYDDSEFDWLGLGPENDVLGMPVTP